jgi:hypothetical protein
LIKAVVQLRPELAAGIVQRLIKSALGCVETRRQFVGGNAIDCQRDQDLALMRGQLVRDQVNQSPQGFLGDAARIR